MDLTSKVGGWSWPGSLVRKCRGDVFSLGTERESTMTTLAYVSGEILHVLWRHVPFTIFVMKSQATSTLTAVGVCIEE